MRNSWIPFGFILLLMFLPSGLVLADNPSDSMGSYPAFKPHWDFEIGLNSSGTPGDQGGGQNANDLSFTMTREFSETGNFMSLSLLGGSQKVEGMAAKYGSLSAMAGLGLGFFLPSISLTAQNGEASLFAGTGGLNLGFQIFDDINLGVNFSGGFSSHQTPLSALIPLPGVPDTLVELDSTNWTGGLSILWATSEIFSFSLSAQTTYESTDQIQNLKHTTKAAVNQKSAIPSSSLGFNWAFLKDFALNGSVQRSEEFEPAGISYSPSLGETVYNDTATTLYFSGYSIGLTFNFE